MPASAAAIPCHRVRNQILDVLSRIGQRVLGAVVMVVGVWIPVGLV